jgi:hypothetical protein
MRMRSYNAFLLFIVCAGASVSPAQGQSGETLSYSFVNGSKVRYSVKASSQINGMPVASERFINQETESVSADGTATLRVRETGSHLAVDKISRDFSVGSTVLKKLGVNGCVIAYEPQHKSDQALVPAATATLIAAGTSPIVPNHPVAVGATWQTVCPSLQAGTTMPAIQSEFQGLESIAGIYLAKILQRVTLPATPASPALNLKTTAWLDRQGIVVRMEQSADAVPTSFGTTSWSVVWELKDSSVAVLSYLPEAAGGSE